MAAPDNSKQPSTSGTILPPMAVHEQIVAIEDMDNDAGYIDPMTLRTEEVSTTVLTGSTTTPGLPPVTNGKVNGTNNSVTTYQRYQDSKWWKYVKIGGNLLVDSFECELNWLISLSAIVSMVLKMPFFVFLAHFILDLVKQRLKAAAKAAAISDIAHKPYEDDVQPGQPPGQSGNNKQLIIEALIFILLLISVIMIQFLVFITHAFNAANCCKNGCCCKSDKGDNFECDCRRKERNRRIRITILSVYFVPLILWVIVFVSSYYLNEWPYFGGGIFMMFQVFIHGNTLTGTPDMYQTKLMKYSFGVDALSLGALIAWFIFLIYKCIKTYKNGSSACQFCIEDATDSNKELTGRSSSSPSGHSSSSISKNGLKVSKNRRHNHPKASTMKWYTINCGCFTMFDPRTNGSRSHSPMHQKMALGEHSCSSSDRGSPSDDDFGSSSTDGGGVGTAGDTYVHSGQRIDTDIGRGRRSEKVVLLASAPLPLSPSGALKEEESRLLQ